MNALSELGKRKREDIINIIKYIKNIFRLRKEIDNSTTKYIRNLFRLKTENETIKDKIIRDLKTLFEEEDAYYKSIKVGNFWKNDYIEYGNNGDKNKNLSIKEYLNEIKPYLKDIITDLQKCGTWKVRLTTAVNLIFSKDNDKEQSMHSKSYNIEVMTYDNANEIIQKKIKSLLSKHQIALETSIKDSDFIFDSVNL